VPGWAYTAGGWGKEVTEDCPPGPTETVKDPDEGKVRVPDLIPPAPPPPPPELYPGKGIKLSPPAPPPPITRYSTPGTLPFACHTKVVGVEGVKV
jgi:hypothetical protein